MNGKRNSLWYRLVVMSLLIAANLIPRQLHAQDAASQSRLKLVIDEKHAVKVYDMHGKLVDGLMAKRVENKNIFLNHEFIAHQLKDLQKTSVKQLVEESNQQQEPQLFDPFIEPATPFATLQPESAGMQSLSPQNPSGVSNLALYTGSGSDNTYFYEGSTHELEVNASVGNFGTTSVSSFRAGFYLSTDIIVTSSDYLVGTATQGGLNANFFATLSTTVDLDDVSNLPSGTYYILLFIDDRGQVAESNENDNVIYYTPTINYTKSAGGSINLTLYTGSGANNTYKYDNSAHVLTINASVGNLGNANTGSFRVGFYLSTDNIITSSDFLVANATQSALNANAFITLSRTIDLDEVNGLPPGAYYVIIFVDDQGQVTESNENDNAVYYTPAFNYTTGGGAVLSITPGFRDVPATGGSTTFSVSNTGTGTMSWSAVANAAWLTITGGASGTNSGTINVNYTANSSSQRTGTITITASGAAGSPKTVEVRQAAAASGPPAIRIAPTSLTIKQP